MGNVQESERRRMIIQRVRQVCRACSITMLCLFLLLCILEIYGVRISFGTSASVKLIAFCGAVGLFLVPNIVDVDMKFFEHDGGIGVFIRDLVVMWCINVFVICSVHNYIYDSNISRILPITVSVAIILAGTQYMFYVIYKSIYERNERLAINVMLKQRQEKSAKRMADDGKTCVLRSEYGKQDLEIRPQSLIYVESVGNYADVYCSDGGEHTNTTIRTTIKQLKDDLQDYGYIVQCHRGFLVNMRYVESLDGTNNSFFLNLIGTEKKIPVSRTCKAAIKAALESVM